MKENASFKTRFVPGNKIRGGRKKGSSPSDWLRRLSHTKINFQNPFTGKVDKAEVSVVVAIQLILKATQDGDLAAIREYFDRLDGKPQQSVLDPEKNKQEINIFVTNILAKAGLNDQRTEVNPGYQEGTNRVSGL